MKKLERRLQLAAEREQVIRAEIFFAGVLSVLSSEKFHKYLSSLMVWFTAISLTSIAENKLYELNLPYPFMLPLALFGLFVYAYFFSDFAEQGKIDLIRSALFSHGWNRAGAILGAGFVIVLLVSVNYFGVLAAGNTSFRYLDKKLLNSDSITMQKDNLKMLSSGVGQSDFSIEKEHIQALREEKRRATSKKERAVADWKIRQSIKSLRAAQMQERNYNKSVITQAQTATNKLQEEIRESRADNNNFIKSQEEWAKYIAVGGEILDGFFIFLFLFMHRTNPSADVLSTLKVGERKSVIDTKEVQQIESQFKKKNDEEIKQISKDKRAFSNQKKSNKSSGKVSLSTEKFERIKELSDTNRKEHVHISRRDLQSLLSEMGESLTPAQMTLYFKRREELGEIYRPNKNGKFNYEEVESLAV